MTMDTFFQQLYLRSLTPFEKRELANVKLRSISTQQFNDYSNFWVNNISKFASKANFKSYCEQIGLNQEEIRRMLADIEIKPEYIDYPHWIESLNIIIHDLAPQQPVENPNDASFLPFFAPFLDYFTQTIQKITPQATQLPLEVVRHLRQQLYQQLFVIAQDVLQQEAAKYSSPQVFVADVLADKYQSLFLAYPFLARRLVVSTDQHIRFIVRFVERFAKDKAEIEYVLQCKLPQLAKLHLGQGDLHHGESTIILEFINHNKVVYKPRNVSVTLAYNKLLDWVNQQLNEQLIGFQVVDKGSYGWLEFIERKDCRSRQEVARYFERAGILLGITYFLNAIDCHYENLIAAGDCPVLIDHETIISAKTKGIQTIPHSHAQSTILVDTVLSSMLLPNRLYKNLAYASGFGSSVSEKPSATQGLAINATEQNKPKLNGRIMRLIDYEQEFKAGFHKLFHLMVRERAYLFSEGSVLHNFADRPVRFINRPTNVYFQILKSLDKAQYLSDATKYGLRLEVLARAFLKSGNWSEILASERTQMLAGDIPIFTINSSAGVLTLDNGKQIDLIECSAMQNLLRKLHLTTDEDYENQIRLIDESVAL